MTRGRRLVIAGLMLAVFGAAAVLKELKNDRKHREIGIQHGVKVIPTQIFFAADGAELFRHQGFMSREDILDK